MHIKKIAILGSTGHIAKGVIDGFCRMKKYELSLFARSQERLNAFLKDISCNCTSPKTFDEFPRGDYDVIINCIGVGDPSKLKEAGYSIFKLTETFDNLVLDYLEKHPQATYINFSSGAVYGSEFNIPVDELSYSSIPINRLSAQNYYGIAKLNSEAKHRALDKFNIVDLRVFSYFSRFIDIKSKFFMSDVISNIIEKKDLVTGKENIIRDYVHPKDLLSLIEKCIAKKTINCAYDVYSKKPAEKFEILIYFSKTYDLKYVVKEKIDDIAPTGMKNIYYSNNRSAEKIGYVPKYTALECILEESAALLSSGAHKSI